MGFTFEKRPELTICGETYEVDLTDTGFVEGVVLDFTAILQKYEVYQALQAELSSKMENLTEEDLRDISQRLTQANREIAEHGRHFIIQVLGQEAYDRIFSQRRPNSMEHLALCSYIYEETVKSRESILEKYIDQPNRGGAERWSRDQHFQTV